MGFLVGGQCVQDQVTAANVMCASAFPFVSNSTTTVYVWQCTAVNAAGTQLTLQRSANGAGQANTTLPVSFSTCDVNAYPSSAWDLSVNDGLIVGTAVVSVWLAAAAWRYLQRTLKDHDNE